MNTQISVTQARGQHSNIWITEDVITGYPNDKRILIFETDQSLESNSQRTLNVENQIEWYARERGYEVQKPYEGKFRVVAIYDEDYHSSILAYKLKEQIKQHPVFLDAAEDAKHQRDILNKEYGRHINELKHLIVLLEKSLDAKLKEIATRLVNEQIGLIEELSRKGIKDHHLFADRHPLVEIKPNHYYKLTDNIPDNLDDILALLD